MLALSPDEVLHAARACAGRGDVRALVVLLEGSGPVDTDQLVATCRTAGMRLVGPHCLGVVNSDPAVALDAAFAPARPARVRVAFAAQSGAFGIAALDLAAQRGVGLSSFVSMGAEPTSRRTTCCRTGRPTPAPTWCCSTQSRSAFRAGSGRSPGA